ncbi:MAG: YjgN family protein [Sphingomonadaceae bacterium]
MNDQGAQDTAFAFQGTWKEFAPIALTNLLLTIVTLGIYRFWAKTRERRYLWSRTRFIDDTLEWTGTGMELFIGFIFAVILFGFPLFMLSFGLQALVFRGHGALAAMLTLPMYGLLLYVFGLARFRALRYRLNRTYWHGIRGGSDAAGWRYGWSWVWKSVVGSFFFGLMLPWSMCDLWNERWNAMSFGPHEFTSGAQYGPVLKRLLLCYALGFVLLIAVFAAVGMAMAGAAPSLATPLGAPSVAQIVMVLIPVLLIVPVIGFCYVAYYSVFLRQAIGGLALTHIDFAFTARTRHWLGLLLGDIALVIGTIGIGFAFLGYRHWKFFVTHLEAGGEVDLDALTQSQTPELKQGEGLLDAFDVGAF